MPILCLAVIELIFFLVAGIVLYFGFSRRIMLITHLCFLLLLGSASTKSRTFSTSHSIDWEGAPEAGREHNRDSWPRLAKGIFHAVWHHARYIRQGNWPDTAIAAPIQAGHQPVGGEPLHWASLIYSIIIIINIIIIVVVISSFAVLLNCFYINPRVIPFFFWFSSPSHHGGMSEQAAA